MFVLPVPIEEFRAIRDEIPRTPKQEYLDDWCAKINQKLREHTSYRPLHIDMGSSMEIITIMHDLYKKAGYDVNYLKQATINEEDKRVIEICGIGFNFERS